MYINRSINAVNTVICYRRQAIRARRHGSMKVAFAIAALFTLFILCAVWPAHAAETSIGQQLLTAKTVYAQFAPQLQVAAPSTEVEVTIESEIAAVEEPEQIEAVEEADSQEAIMEKIPDAIPTAFIYIPENFNGHTLNEAKKMEEEEAARLEAVKEEARIAAEKASKRIVLSAEERELLAQVIFWENGHNGWKALILTGSVVLNRMFASDYPDTIKGVVYQKGQYATVPYLYTKDIPDFVYEAVDYLLENGSQAPEDVIYQAMFIQGSEVYDTTGPDEDHLDYYCRR